MTKSSKSIPYWKHIITVVIKKKSDNLGQEAKQMKIKHLEILIPSYKLRNSENGIQFARETGISDEKEAG